MVDTIAELASLSQTLNKKSDTLNATIDSINEKLAKLNFGLVVWLENQPIVHEGTRYVLGYEKHQDLNQIGGISTYGAERWQLAVSDDRSAYSRPLLRAPREVRIQALDRVPDLLSLMKERAEELIGSIERAEKLAETL